MAVGDREPFFPDDETTATGDAKPKPKAPGSAQIMQTGSVNVTSQESTLQAKAKGYGSSINFMKPAPGAGEVHQFGS